MVVPGTEPGPITNYFTYGFVDCSGYYINYNNTQYKICNYAAAQAAGIVHLAPIIVSGKFLSDCGDNTPVCQMYHPYAGLFWLDSVSAIPNKPNKTNCWDDHQFNTTTLVWENKGSKPNVPSTTNCWDSFQFNGTSCSWENIGSQPDKPTDTIYVYQFDSTKCLWDNVGLKDSSKLSVDRVETKDLIWPNPFNDRIEMSLAPGSYGTLTTIDGKTVMRFDSTENVIDTQLLVPGTYFLNITIDRRTTSLKAVKN